LKIGLQAEPGSEFRYGRAFDLSGCVVERATAKTFFELMDERVIRPLGLSQTTLKPTERQVAELRRI